MLEIRDLATSTPLGLYEREQGYAVSVQAQVLAKAVTLSHFHCIVEN